MIESVSICVKQKGSVFKSVCVRVRVSEIMCALLGECKIKIKLYMLEYSNLYIK